MMFSYTQANPKYVKFQRIFMGWLAIASLFMREIDGVWFFFGVTLLGLFMGTAWSIPTLFYKLVKRLFDIDLVRITSYHMRYYEINNSMDFIDHILRLIASSCVLLLFYANFELAAWLLLSFLSIFMMLSAYFGFCLSALTFVAIHSVFDRWIKNSTSSLRETSQGNPSCALARKGFMPYKRCDSCHIKISQCLGTKFNSSVLIIGVLMALFIFIEDVLFVQINIIVIMAILFWLGYAMNYNTDELAQSNDENIALNTQLKTYTHSLEEEVKRRTAEIEHLATHDMLTGLLNRFSFETLVLEALEATKHTPNSYHLAYIDLDRFKAVNDSAGHLAGDKLLRKVSTAILDAVAQKGKVARLGGDEFSILFQNTTQSYALEVSEALCQTLFDLNFQWEGKHYTIGASIGLATIDATMQDVNAVLYHADTVLYTAKKSGRGQVCVHTPHA